MKKDITLLEHLRSIASKGGLASAKKLTKEQRIARALKASHRTKRWRKLHSLQ